jgi:hypothetical protein
LINNIRDSLRKRAFPVQRRKKLEWSRCVPTSHRFVFAPFDLASGVELVHKIIKCQFGLPESFGTDPFHVWYNVLAA